MASLPAGAIVPRASWALGAELGHHAGSPAQNSMSLTSGTNIGSQVSRGKVSLFSLLGAEPSARGMQRCFLLYSNCLSGSLSYPSSEGKGSYG